MLSVTTYKELPPCWQLQHHDDPVTSIWILLLCYHQIASSHMLLPFNMLSTCSSDVFCILDKQCGLFKFHACNIEASWAQHSQVNHPDPLSKITTKWKQYCEGHPGDVSMLQARTSHQIWECCVHYKLWCCLSEIP